MPRQPRKLTPPPSTLALLAEGVSAGVISTAATAVAASIALIALSFAIYAGFKEIVSPALASAFTALAFAAVAAIIATVVPRSLKARSKTKKAEIEGNRTGPSAATIRRAAEIALAVIGALAETTLNRRTERKLTQDAKRRRR